MIPTHGNAAVESGFCINSDILVEKQHQSSVVAQRQGYDVIRCHGGVLKVKLY